MSVNYWGFTRTPFTKDLPIQEFFPSAQFRELTARLPPHGGGAVVWRGHRRSRVG